MATLLGTIWMEDLARWQATAIQPQTARTLLAPMLAYCSAHWLDETREIARHALAAAELYLDLLEPDEALGFFAKAIETGSRNPVLRAPELAAAHLGCGLAYLQTGQDPEALLHLLEATGYHDLFDVAEDGALEVAVKIALARLRLGEPEGALPFARWALGFQQRRYGILHRGIAVTSFLMAQALEAGTGDRDATRPEREVFLKRAIGTLRQTSGDEVFLAHALLALGELHLEGGDLDCAIPAVREAVDCATRARGETHPLAAWALAALGSLRLRAGSRDLAEQPLLQALAIARGQPLSPGDLLEAILEPLAQVSYDLMRLSDHIEYSDELKRVRAMRSRRCDGPSERVPVALDGPDRLPAFMALSCRADEAGERKLAWLG